MCFVHLVLVTVLCPWMVLNAPIPDTKGQLPPTEVLSFMKRFGYLEEDDGMSEALYSEDGIAEAIMTMQKFGNISQTGVIDEDTLMLMKSPRCGVSDVVRKKRSKRFIIGSDGWSKRRITYFVANWSPTLGEYAVVKNIQKALDTWGRYGRLTFDRTANNDADIIVAFGRGYHGDRYPFDGRGNILAHAFFPYEDGSGGDIHFDDDEIWTDRQADDPDDGTDFFTVAVHELGHSLGLGHSHHPSSIMFPYYRGFNPSTFSLDYDDILGMYELYIRRHIDDDGYQQPSSAETDHTTSTSTTTEATTRPTTTRWYTTTTPTTTTAYSTPSEANHTIFYGDDAETVDDHKQHDTTHGIPSTNSPSLPDICAGYFDAVATLRNEMFVFKDEYVWRLKEQRRVEPSYPVPISRMFPSLPKTKKVDAVYERPDGRIVLFVGAYFWVYDGTDFVEGSPRPLTDYGLPSYLDRVDAVQIWGKNGKTYIYRNERFWRYNEQTKQIDAGYPKHMERWRGVPENLDAATTWKDGSTYFFKGKHFWRFDNDWIIVTEGSPMPAPQIWLGCPEDMSDRLLHSADY